LIVSETTAEVGKMDTVYYDNLWEPKQGSRQGDEAFWDGRADHFSNRTPNQTDREERMVKLFSLLTEKGMLTKSSSVLDIGCGPGKHAIEMARISKEVIGIDISSKMLAYAKNSSKNTGLKNLNFIKRDWEQVYLKELKWEKRFDLVFAFMCPAINNKNALEKMNRASKGYCFMSTFAKREESIRDRLAEVLLPGWHLKQQGNSVYCCFNLLWLMGYYPEITYMDSQYVNTFSQKEAFEYYSAALPIPGGLSKNHREFIKNYLQQHDNQGLITEHVKMKFAWVYWQV